MCYNFFHVFVPRDLFTIMLKAYDRCSLMGCSIEPDPNVYEARTDVGLVRGHAYSLTKVLTNMKLPCKKLRQGGEGQDRDAEGVRGDPPGEGEEPLGQ